VISSLLVKITGWEFEKDFSRGNKGIKSQLMVRKRLSRARRDVPLIDNW